MSQNHHQGFVHFGDICVFKENNPKSYLTCPLTSSHHANLVVPDGKGNGGGVPGASFQSCQFQIVAEEKSKWCAKVRAGPGLASDVLVLALSSYFPRRSCFSPGQQVSA